MKMLMFDLRESEEIFFQTREFSDIDITFIKEPLNEHTKLSNELYNTVDIISVFISSKLSEKVLKKFKNLRIISTRSTGYNHIDTSYCSKHHIAVFNVEKYGEKSVAQYTIALILALTRNLIPAFLNMRQGVINHAQYEGNNTEALTLGIIGCGSIGSSVAKLAHTLGFNIIINSISKNPEITPIAEFVPLDILLEKSDIITLHLPYTQGNYHFLGTNEFNKMKKGVYIVNTSRGELIDIVSMYKNLISEKIKGVALDVLECEYLSDSNSNIIENIVNSSSLCITNALIAQKISSMPNVILTPHIAYNTKESVEFILNTTFNNILDYHKGFHNNQIC